MIKLRLLIVAFLLPIVANAQKVIFPQEQQAGTATASVSDGTYTLSNDLLTATFIHADGKLTFGGCTAMGLQASDDLFSIRLSNGTEIASSAMTLTDVSLVNLTADASAAKGSLKLPGKAVEATYTSGDLRLTWRAVLRNGSHYLRTELELTAVADVAMNAVIPMHYTVDNSSSEQAPAVVGNTRGAVIASDKIFAGLQTPMGKNSIVGGIDTGAFDYDSWTGSTFDWECGSDTPQGIINLGLSASATLGTKGYLAILKGGTQTVTFQWSGGSHRLDIAGVDLIDPATGNVVASDYHKAYTGGGREQRAYTLNIPAPGYYLVRYFRDTETDHISGTFNSNGSITWSCEVVAPELLLDGNTAANVLPASETTEQVMPSDASPAQTVIELDGANASDSWTSSSWSAVSSVPAPVAAFNAQFSTSNIVKQDKAIGFSAKGGILSVTFTYGSGSHGLNIVGVELIRDGEVASSDYHIGFSGSAKKYNTYTVYVPATGDYTLRYLCETNTETLTSSGNITLSYATTSTIAGGGTRTDAWTTSSWQAETFVPAEILAMNANYRARTPNNDGNVKVYEKTLNLTTTGRMDAQFVYSGGSNRLNMVGVELVDNTGAIVSSDYHFGYTGNAHSNNTYSVYAPLAGFYHIRYYVEFYTDANTSSGNINLSYTEYPLMRVSGSRVDAWTPESWSAPASVPARINELGYASENIKIMEKTIRFIRGGGTFNAQFMYSSGNHGLTIAGVELVEANGGITASDYHSGFSGNAKTNHNYTFTVPAAGFYTLRYYVVLNPNGSDNTSSGNINLSYNKTEYLHLPAPTETEFKGEWSRQTTLAAGRTWKVGTVVGLIAPGQARRSFLCYSERERAVPWRAFPMYNSWYELNINRNNDADYSSNFTEAQCAEVLSQWKTHLFDPYGVGIGSFVWDDGWDEYGTWQFNSHFPDGFQNLSDQAWNMDSQIGAWLGPVGGYGTSGTYRRNYWSSRGGMQLSNPDYYDVFLDRTSYMLNTYHFNFFKFDGISAQFSSVGPDPGATGEENAEGIINIEQELRKVKPDVFLNTTVGTWASPFWFQVTDAVWRQENDWDRIGDQGSVREKWITYRDRLVYQNFVRNSPLCPINTIMTHGFILTNYGPPAAMNNDYADVVRELRCAFACGSGMVEVYADFALMNSINGGALWGDLAECIKWQKKMEDVLPDVHWVGGNPWDGSKANVYGWAAWNGEKATLALRNPSASAQSFTTTLREALEIPDYISGYITLTDAFTQSALSGLTTGTPIDIDATLTLSLAASSVYVYNGVDGAPLTLYDNSDNSTAISDADGQRRTVTLSGRTLYKDGEWNTLCLPFEVGDPDASKDHWFDDTPLEGATVMALANSPESTSFDPSSGTLTLYFVEADMIEAGVPYLVKWASGDNIANPVFTGVTIDNDLNDITSDDGKVTFRGNYAPVTYTEATPSVLILSTGNKLKYPSGDGTVSVRSFRAYFHVDLGETPEVKAFVLNFGDKETGMNNLTPDPSPRGEGSWYDVSGRKVADGQQPTAKGLYINNGKKIMVK